MAAKYLTKGASSKLKMLLKKLSDLHLEHFPKERV